MESPADILYFNSDIDRLFLSFLLYQSETTGRILEFTGPQPRGFQKPIASARERAMAMIDSERSTADRSDRRAKTIEKKKKLINLKKITVSSFKMLKLKKQIIEPKEVVNKSYALNKSAENKSTENSFQITIENDRSIEAIDNSIDSDRRASGF